jgi:hypothetical protein
MQNQTIGQQPPVSNRVSLIDRLSTVVQPRREDIDTEELGRILKSDNQANPSARMHDPTMQAYHYQKQDLPEKLEKDKKPAKNNYESDESLEECEDHAN